MYFDLHQTILAELTAGGFTWDSGHLYPILLLFVSTIFIIVRIVLFAHSILLYRALKDFDPVASTFIDDDEPFNDSLLFTGADGDGDGDDDEIEIHTNDDGSQFDIADILRNTKLRDIEGRGGEMQYFIQ